MANTSEGGTPCIPDSVRIGPMLYSIVATEDLHGVGSDGVKFGLFGQIDEKRQQISLHADNGPDINRCTLLHEAMHGILYVAGIQSDHDERTIDALAYGVVSLLRQNPALAAYLASDLSGAEAENAV